VPKQRTRFATHCCAAARAPCQTDACDAARAARARRGGGVGVGKSAARLPSVRVICAYTGARVSAFFGEPAAAARQLAADSARCVQRLAAAAARARAAAGGGMG
jgi:hypothetical protein